MLSFNPDLFKLARESRGISQKELSAQLNIAQSEISKAESGKKVPGEDFVEKTAAFLGYTPEFFAQTAVSIPDAGIRHRKRSALPTKARVRIEAEAVTRMFDVGIMAVERGGQQPELLFREGRTPEDMARLLRKAWGIPAGPIENLATLLERHGLLLIPFDFGTGFLDAFAIPQPDPDAPICIAVNINPAFTPDRRRFTLAHELGHVVLHRDEVEDESAAKRQEKEANAFASEFLAPAADIKPELEQSLSFARLRALKARWKVSMSSLVYRATALGILSPKESKRMWFLFGKYGYRKHEPPMGLEHEYPIGLECLAARFARAHGDAAAELLHLTPSHFATRYPKARQQGETALVT